MGTKTIIKGLLKELDCYYTVKETASAEDYMQLCVVFGHENCYITVDGGLITVWYEGEKHYFHVTEDALEFVRITLG